MFDHTVADANSGENNNPNREIFMTLYLDVPFLPLLSVGLAITIHNPAQFTLVIKIIVSEPVLVTSS